MPKLKPGFITSEFVTTIITSVVGILVSLGYLEPVQADEFQKAILTVLGGLTTISVTIVYIYGRIKLKNTQLQNSSQAVEVLNETLSDEPEEVPAVYPK